MNNYFIVRAKRRIFTFVNIYYDTEQEISGGFARI